MGEQPGWKKLTFMLRAGGLWFGLIIRFPIPAYNDDDYIGLRDLPVVRGQCPFLLHDSQRLIL